MPEYQDVYVRPSWDEYFMEVCDAISKRATCDRGRSGCVIARDHQILVTGYVGAPAGLSLRFQRPYFSFLVLYPI
ncbi:hypothetical protein FACS189496_4300 [Bacilli bacterium]|nr:hypothetical protein FACS189496_4300 [Bacilli bacterium]